MPFPDHGGGLCVFNDVAVSLAQLLANRSIARAAVVDCDVHQRNGTVAKGAGCPHAEA